MLGYGLNGLFSILEMLLFGARVGYPLPKMRKTLIRLSALRENDRKPSLIESKLETRGGAISIERERGCIKRYYVSLH